MFKLWITERCFFGYFKESLSVRLHEYTPYRPLFHHICVFLGLLLTEQTFQTYFKVAFRLICSLDALQRQINVETTSCMSKLGFTTLNNVESILSVIMSIFTMFGNVEAMWVWPFEKKQKNKPRFNSKIICWSFK